MTEKDIPKELNLTKWNYRNGYSPIFTKNIKGREITGLFEGFGRDFFEINIVSIIDFVKKVFENIEELDRIAKKIVQKETNAELVLDFLVFKKDFSLLLGYPVKEEAGYFYTKFNNNLTADEKVIFEFCYYL